jgi:hypothetical protein
MRWLRRVLVGLVVVVLVAATAFVAWAANPREAEPGELAAARADPAVQVVQRDGYLAVLPAGPPPTDGVVFYPGARVAPAAYVPTWAPIVARTGVAVFVPSMPLNLAFFAIGRADDVRAAEPGIDRWWLGGHSLGGAMATSYLGRNPDGDVRGLILWASFATEGAGLRDRTDLAVLSVSGSRDGLSTPAEIAARRALLPPGAELVEIDGMNHAQFGRYGPQRGDRPPAITDAEAQRRLTDAVVSFLAAPAGVRG